VPTEPLRKRERQNRTALKEFAAQASQQLRGAEIEKRPMAPIEAQLRRLAGADENDTDDDKIRKLQNKSLIRSMSLEIPRT
jgi:hypothetical protein